MTGVPFATIKPFYANVLKELLKNVFAHHSTSHLFEETYLFRWCLLAVFPYYITDPRAVKTEHGTSIEMLLVCETLFLFICLRSGLIGDSTRVLFVFW